MTPKFIPGAVYESTTHGLVEFKGVDRYMGQSTLHFHSLQYNESCYWLPEALDRHFPSAQETVPAPEQSVRNAFARSPRRVQETGATKRRGTEQS